MIKEITIKNKSYLKTDRDIKMKTIIILMSHVFILFYLNLELMAQAGWYWQNPIPQGNNLYDVFFVGTNNGWAVGGNGSIIHTDDGGLSWSQQHSTTQNDLYATFFINDNAGWAVGIYGTLLHWNGDKWESQNSQTSAHLNDVYFINTQIGWVVGDNQTFLFTEDGGENWTQIGFTGTQYRYFSVYFIDQDHGYVAGATGSYGIIRYTSDGGSSWVRQLIPTNILNCIHFANENTGWAVGKNGIIYHKEHPDSDWTRQNLEGTTNLLSVHASNPSQIWIAGEDGRIFYSNDAGLSWFPQISKVTDDLRSVFMLDGSSGWAAGNGGTIIRTNDSGGNWSELSGGTTAILNDIDFDELDRGIVVGDTGTIYLSYDGGESWEKDSSGISLNLYAADLAFSPIYFDHATVAGWGGIILKKMIEPDSPEDTWQPIGWLSHEDLLNIHMFYRTGWAVGHFGTIIHTTNGGFDWDVQHQDLDLSYHLYGIHFPSLNYGYAVGMQGKILKTENGGEYWFEQTSPTINSLNAVHFSSLQVGWAVGIYGTIIYTVDGGNNWFEKSDITSNRLNDVYFTDSNNGWIVGAFGTILYTQDGGETWAHQWSGTDNELNAVYFSDPARGWICGENGTILHTEDGGGFTYYQIYPRIGLNKDIMDLQILEDALWVGSSKKMAQAGNLIGVEVLIDSIIHPSVGELEFTLSHADITDTLIFNSGIGEADFINLKLSDAATMPIDSGTGPFTGTYKPYKPLSVFSNLDPEGEWILRIYDGKEGNIGKLHSWSLKLYTAEVTAIEPIKFKMPTGFILHQNYPNPFNSKTVIDYSVGAIHESPVHIELSIYNILGQKVATLVSQKQHAGTYQVEWDATAFASGIYLYTLTIDKRYKLTKKLVLLK